MKNEIAENEIEYNKNLNAIEIENDSELRINNYKLSVDIKTEEQKKKKGEIESLPNNDEREYKTKQKQKEINDLNIKILTEKLSEKRLDILKNKNIIVKRKIDSLSNLVKTFNAEIEILESNIKLVSKYKSNKIEFDVTQFALR